MKELLNSIYEKMGGSEVSMTYSARHRIDSAAILTVTDDETASLIAADLAPRIAGKVVIEIGGGIGLLALHLGTYAKRVFCIEANPMWSSAFAHCLLERKPKNVSYLFGSADEFAGQIKGDVAIFCSHSGLESMKSAGLLFAPEVIDFYGEMIKRNPGAFDKTASKLREFA